MRRGRVAAPIVVGAVVGLGLWYFGTSVWWAAAVALLAAALVFGWRSLPQLEEGAWPPRAPETNVGARDDVQVLGWAFAGKRGRVHARALERARSIARDRLSFYGLDLDEASDRERVVALIGARPYATLHSNVASTPSQSALLACLDALDRLTVPSKEKP
jgi:hypothetical protein